MSALRVMEVITEKDPTPTPDLNEPNIEEQWCAARRADVLDYLAREHVSHGQVGDWPAWHVAPYVSIWAIESQARPDWVGWWAIAGDLPTDYISSHDIKDPRAAMAAISSKWLEVSSCMLRGEPHPEIQIGTPKNWPTLGPCSIRGQRF